MAIRKMFKHIVHSCVLGGVLFVSSMSLMADEHAEVKPLALRIIMQDMAKNMEAITGAISREDWPLIVKTAPLIAEHPQPPMAEKIKIMSFIASEAATFKRYDKKTHDTAKELEIAAAHNEGKEVIAVFAKLQTSCLACHQAFRKPFVEYFYPLK